MADSDLHHPSFSELTRVSARIGFLSFGGPAGQIALMHRELVDERRWVEEDDYLQALNLCHLLPGPEAQQLATWIGWKLHGWKGGVIAGALFVIPGALVMLALSMLYAFAANLDWFAALFLGIKAAVLAIIVQALLRIAGRALKTPIQKGMAVAAFAALFLFNAPFPLVVLAALAIGAWIGAKRPDLLALKPVSKPGEGHPSPWRASLIAVLAWSVIWAAPMVAVLVFLGREHVLWDIGVFFSQLAVVTFGGAYAVLAYMAQEAVTGFGWLSAGEMADGLGLAETTPGPLIMVTQFVGYLAAFRAPEPFSPLVAGVLGAVLTTWVTFAPCFLWIFAFAPWMDRLQRAPALKGGLAGVTAAVVGVIANLALWFALHVLFAVVDPVALGPIVLQVPEWATFDWRAALIAVVAAALIFRFKWGIIRTLGVAAAMGLALGSLV
ncbi:chromate efflux transporter [Altererythrobacter sp. Root672]|uniref:chromate efflux transporter n=1 Tax=Altererythrobacter sp. Root672 TaxID=1736584 RepID=UPI0006F419B5|nr:chromate efflux transporter [Altererythrobacter sp. Root672]KRA83031.1 chromate transporter [Altererythrobacter sp. Root672]